VFFKSSSCFVKNRKCLANKTAICKKLTKERANTSDLFNAPKLPIKLKTFPEQFNYYLYIFLIL
jgi:hypothetical protein